VSIKSSIFNNIGLKILALFTAIVIWFYVAGEQDHTKTKKMIGGKTQKESSRQR